MGPWVQPRQSGSTGCSGAGTLCCSSPGHTKGPGGKSGGLLKRKLRKEKKVLEAGEGQMVKAETQGRKNNWEVKVI